MNRSTGFVVEDSMQDIMIASCLTLRKVPAILRSLLMTDTDWKSLLTYVNEGRSRARLPVVRPLLEQPSTLLDLCGIDFMVEVPESTHVVGVDVTYNLETRESKRRKLEDPSRVKAYKKLGITHTVVLAVQFGAGVCDLDVSNPSLIKSFTNKVVPKLAAAANSDKACTVIT